MRTTLRSSHRLAVALAVSLMAGVALVGFAALAPRRDRTVVKPANVVGATVTNEASAVSRPRDAEEMRSVTRRLILIVNPEKSPDEVTGSHRVVDALHEVTDAACEIVHFRLCSPELLADKRPRAVVVVGQKTPWWEYTAAELSGVEAMLRSSAVPTLGICGGHQLICMAFGGKVAPIRRVSGTPEDGYTGCLREKGWMSLQRTVEDALLDGLEPRFTAWDNHCEEVKQLPDGFVQLASGGTSPVQGMRHAERPVYGLQFHPEISDSTHGSGRVVLRNFVRLAGLKDSED